MVTDLMQATMFIFLFEIGTYCVAHASLELGILLLQAHES